MRPSDVDMVHIDAYQRISIQVDSIVLLTSYKLGNATESGQLSRTDTSDEHRNNLHRTQSVYESIRFAHHGHRDSSQEPQIPPGGLHQQAGVLTQRVEGVEHLHHHQHRHRDGGRPPVCEYGARVGVRALRAALE